MWFPGLNGDFSAGPLSESVDLSFIDIAGKLRSFPAAFNGHLEAHYERLGFYLDGNYLGLDFEPRFDGGIAKGLSTELGVMDYGVSYRLFGSTASERVAHWEEKSPSNILASMPAVAPSGRVTSLNSGVSAVFQAAVPSPLQ